MLLFLLTILVFILDLEFKAICKMCIRDRPTVLARVNGISIHTFLTEGDPVHQRCVAGQRISIHTFLTEGDATLLQSRPHLLLFQSTPSSQKVTNLIGQKTL